MIKVKDGYAKLIGITYLGSANNVLLSNGGNVVLAVASTADALVKRDASGNIYGARGIFESDLAGIVSVKRTVSLGGAFIDYYHSNQTNFWRVGANYNGLFSFAYNGTELGLKVNTSGQLVSEKATGTSPFKITSTTVNTNLNSDLLDGWHVTDIVRSGYVTSSTQDLTSYWCKLWEYTRAEVYNDVDVTFYIHSAYNQYRGFVHLRVRRNEVKDSNNNVTGYSNTVSLNLIAGNIPTKHLRLYHDNGTEGKAELWANVASRYGVYNCKIISSTNRVGLEQIPFGTLFRTIFSEVLTPTLSSFLELTPISNANILVVYHKDNDIEYPLVWSNQNNTTSAISNLLYKSYPHLTYNPSKLGISVKNISTYNITSPDSLKLIGATEVCFRFGDSDSTSLVLNSLQFKPYDSANGVFDLGSTSARWKGFFAQTANFTGTIYLAADAKTYRSGGLGIDVGINMTGSNYPVLGKINSQNGVFTLSCHAAVNDVFLIGYISKTTLDDSTKNLLDASFLFYSTGILKLLGLLGSSGLFSSTGADILTVNRNSSNPTWIRFKNLDALVGYLGVSADKSPYFNDTTTTHALYHSGNTSHFFLAKSRVSIGTSPNFDDPGFNGVFEIRKTSETTGETGTKPVDSFMPCFTMKTPDEIAMLLIAGVNTHGFYIRGKQSSSVTLADTAWAILAWTGTTPVSGQVAVYDGTTGKIKPSGYTIDKSVPSTAVFTDTKVQQTAVTYSIYTNWRPLMIGASSSSTEGFTPTTVTDQVYTTSNIQVQPSTGTIKATTFKGALSGNATTATTATNLASAPTIATSTGTNEITLAHGGKYSLTVGGKSLVFTMPSDTNTHYTSKNVVGSTTATSNTTTALTNGNVYINSVENGAVTSTHKISGSGATTVTTDASGNIIITSTDNNTTYSSATTSTLGLLKVSNKLSAALTLTSSNGTTADRFYGVLMDSNGVAFVNVPWTNTTYSTRPNPYALTLSCPDALSPVTYTGASALSAILRGYKKVTKTWANYAVTVDPYCLNIVEGFNTGMTITLNYVYDDYCGYDSGRECEYLIQFDTTNGGSISFASDSNVVWADGVEQSSAGYATVPANCRGLISILGGIAVLIIATLS